MNKRTLFPAAALALAVTAFAVTRPSAAPEPCGCFDPAACGDREVVCPAGPDCFMPTVCPDRDLVCPADAASAVADAAE